MGGESKITVDRERIAEHVEKEGRVTIAEFYCWEADKEVVSLGRAHPEGAGYITVGMIDECPECGRIHWRDD